MTNQIDKEFNTSEILADQNTADTTGIQIDSEPTSAVEDKSIETHENGMERDLVAESEDRKIIIVPTNQVEQGTSQSAELVFHNRPSVKTMTNNRPTSWSRSDPSTAIRPSKLRQSFGSVDENDIETVHRPKRHCWCFKSLLLCIGVILVILAGLGLLIFFLFPAPPGIEVSDPFQPPGSAGFLVNNKSISELSPSILQEPMLILSIGLATNVKFNSTSYITFGIRQIDVTVGIKDGLNNVISDFKGEGQVSDLRLPARESTNFTFPFDLEYKMNTTGNLINSPGIQILASNCLTVPQKNLNMQLTVRLDIAAISWIGWRPSYTFDRAQACPSIEQLAALVKALTSGA